MNPFLLPILERLKEWKAFRTSLPSLMEDEQLRRVASFWSQAPLSKFAYDPECAESWPTIWEMICENQWCRLSIAIGMEQTLRLAGWNSSRLTLRLINDRDAHDIFFVVDVDGTKWLNYEFGAVVEKPDTNYYVICNWQFEGKSYISVPVAL